MSGPSDSSPRKRADGADEAADDALPGAATLGPRALPWRSRLPGAAFLRTHRRGARRIAATVTGAAVAAAVLFGSGGSLPQGGGIGYADAPLRPYAASPADFSSDSVTVDQVLGVLERAHELAVQQGASMDPQVAQAAAELGMLYITYRGQQEAIRAASGVLDPRDGSVVGPAAGGSDLPAVVGEEAGRADESDADESDAEHEPADSEKPDTEKPDSEKPDSERGDEAPGEDQKGGDGDAGTVTEVSRVFGLGANPVDDLGADDSGRGEAEAHDHDVLVTHEDLVVAAQRLARLMDPTTTDALVVAPIPAAGPGEVADSADPRLRENLVSIVDAFSLSTAGFANGRIPVDVLCPLTFAPGHRLRCDAAERLTALNAEYEKRFGRSIPMTDSYRTLESQVRLRASKPTLAAIPGTSNHGWGIAVDLGVPISSGRSAEYAWLRVHGPDYGWDNPAWARLNGSKPEPWHFEFFAAGAIPNRAVGISDVSSEDDPRYRPPTKAKPGDGPAVTPAKKPNGGGTSGGSNDPSKDPGDGSVPSSKPPRPTPKPSPSPSGEPTPSPSPSGEPTPSPSPSGDPTPTPSPSPSDDPTPTPTPSPSEPSPSPSPSGDPTPSPSPSGDPTPTPSPSPSDDPTPSPEPSGSGEPDQSAETGSETDGDSNAACSESADDPGSTDGVTDGDSVEEPAGGTDDSEPSDCDSDDPASGDDPEAESTPSSDSPDGSSGQTDALTGVVGTVAASALVRRRDEDEPDEDDPEDGDREA
ncbi:M15 family metallopeptidase [Myceligenerans indicum]|uniref:D-alanyl-D-alanine carboxypeptidase-like core domain-containing protein n=1 Tax=Myceligenerans indicum TaxID=2593663 RepID=A0ABS1LIR5_9MICO|nr:M15 family metallopeptidase [Myceligenerans indicum]MBL0886122.1 hypothetical protein [Myceligenerans indicum]